MNTNKHYEEPIKKRHPDDYPGWAISSEMWSEETNLQSSPLVTITNSHKKKYFNDEDITHGAAYNFVDRLLHDEPFDSFTVWKWFFNKAQSNGYRFDPAFVLNRIFQPALFQFYGWQQATNTERKVYCDDVKKKAKELRTALNVIEPTPFRIVEKNKIPSKEIRLLLEDVYTKNITIDEFFVRVEQVYDDNVNSPYVIFEKPDMTDYVINSLIRNAEKYKNYKTPVARPRGITGHYLYFLREVRSRLNKLHDNLGNDFEGSTEEAILLSIAFNKKFTIRDITKLTKS